MPHRIEKSLSPKIPKIATSESIPAIRAQTSATKRQLFPEAPEKPFSPRVKATDEARTLQQQLMKLQAQLETSKHSEDLLRREVEVSDMQRRDALIESQSRIIGELKAELGAYKHGGQTKPEGQFLDYLVDFQAETVVYNQARLTAETEALLSKHERKVPQLNSVRNFEQFSGYRDELE